MKLKTLGLLSLLAVFFMAACEGIFNNVEFEFDSDSTIFTLEKDKVRPGEFVMAGQAMPSDLQKQAEENGIKVPNLTSLKVAKVVLEIASPDSLNLNFNALQEVALSMHAEGLDTVEFATITDIPDSVSTLELETTDKELLPYLEQTEVQVFMRGVADGELEQDTDIRTIITFLVSGSMEEGEE